MEKNADLKFSISAIGNQSITSNIRFSTQDEGSAKLTFFLFKDGVEMPLNAVVGKLVMRMNDGSKFTDSVTIVDKVNGIAEYKLTSEQLKHVGKVTAELYLYYEEQKLSVHRFTFTIAKALIDEDIPVLTEFYVDDFENLKTSINTMAVETKEIINIVGADVEVAKGKADEAISLIEQNQVVKLPEYNENKQQVSDQLTAIEINAQTNTYKLNKAMMKLKTGIPITIACQGDSTTASTDSTSSREPDPAPTNNGTYHYAKRASITYPESLQKYMRRVYGDDKVTVINRGFEGDGTKRGYEHWNMPSGADVMLIMYGINDADNSSIDYMGDVEEFIRYYRLIIEQELRNGTAVIMLSPIRLRIATGTTSVLRHTKIQAFGEAAKMLANEYNIPCVDMHEMLRGYGADIYSDYTHLNGIGYELLGARLSSIFIGRGSIKPFTIKSGKNLGVSLMNDSFVAANVQGWYYQTNPITATEDDSSGGGTYLNLRNPNAFITYSFYANEDNLIVSPNFQFAFSDPFEFEMQLDYGLQPQQILNKEMVDNLYPLAPITSQKYYQTDKNNSQRFSPSMMKNVTDKHIIIPSRGWHTITFKVNQTNASLGIIAFYGFKVESVREFMSRTNIIIPLTLENGFTPFDDVRKPQLVIANGIVTIEGLIAGLSTRIGQNIATIPAPYRPKEVYSYLCPNATSNNGAYANITIGTNGSIIVQYSSTAADIVQLASIKYPLK